MCGICGFYGFKDDDVLEKMCHAIRHRGPDQAGTYTSDNVSLGHRRLSIIDLSTHGRQPISNEDESLWLTYNGEIYNFQELRSDLESKGHVFKSHTDSEVILHAYEEKGLECIDDFQGMFAFALWDSGRDRLILCRDRLGIKPLYYWWDGKKLVFASEIKSIIKYPNLPRKVNLEGFYSFLAFQYVPGEETAIKNVYRLPPAHMLVLESGNIVLKEYWNLGSAEIESWKGSEQEALDHLGELLTKSVDMRLISDVPLGVLLSGGLDSSSIVASMVDSGMSTVKTFSVGFGENNDELKYAGIVSRYFNTEHHEFIIRPKDLADTLERIVWHLDEPLADGGAFATFLVSEVVKNHVKVVLVGEGADELFGGYSWHKLASRYLSVAPEVIKKKIYFYLNTFYKPLNGLPDRYGYFSALFDNENLDRKSFLSKMSNFEIKSLLPNCLLMKVDKMTMAHSIEARVPFLDHTLLEFVSTLPKSYKVHGLTGKYILRKAMKGRLPKEILERRKRGFMIPLDRWMEEGLREHAREVLKDSSSFSKELLGEKRLQELFTTHRGLKGIESRVLLWRFLIFEVWFSFYIKSGNKTVSTA